MLHYLLTSNCKHPEVKDHSSKIHHLSDKKALHEELGHGFMFSSTLTIFITNNLTIDLIYALDSISLYFTYENMKKQ